MGGLSDSSLDGLPPTRATLILYSTFLAYSVRKCFRASYDHLRENSLSLSGGRYYGSCTDDLVVVMIGSLGLVFPP